MDKTYNPATEEEIYRTWENSGAFTPTVPDKPVEARKQKEPFTVILPPPNANEPLHAGHALYTVEDIMVRFHRMLGDPTLWLPGTDHAGIETQFVFEKHLKAEGKSRFDYDRDTLYQLIANYVSKNSDIAINQMKRLGFSLDWTRLRFANDPAHNGRINSVFKKMVNDGLVYRDEKIVNYCTYCGTAYSNLEVVHKPVASHLWFIKYPIVGEAGKFIEMATTRPETMLGDTAVAVNPKDPRYQDLIGKKALLPLVNREIPIIGEETIDMKFGTGAVKVTPSHSPEDYDMAKKHGLEFIRIFNYDGKGNDNIPPAYRGLYPSQIRDEVIKNLDAAGLLIKTQDYTHEVGHCYKCGRPIEPMTAPQWFVKIASLADKAREVVKTDAVRIFPKRFKKQFLTWMKDVRDWNISRQIVWAQRIPVWYNLDDNPDILINFITSDKKIISDYWKNLQSFNFEEISAGLQTLLVPANTRYYLSPDEAKKSGSHVLQETDVFDTWFSSGQWPYSTLGYNPDNPHASSPDFFYFYPTAVLDTMWDILFFWVARMIMMGLYVTGDIPFKVAHMHSRVLDGKGQKMSKSKGNTINPVDIAGKYGADALRMALVIGVAPGSDIALSEDKIRSQRNFVNKIWNASRFVLMMIDRFQETNLGLSLTTQIDPAKLTVEDKAILEKLNTLIKTVTDNLNNYHFGRAGDDLYSFFWHEYCDVYIESAKSRDKDVVPVLLTVLLASLKLLHPFMPFVTESVYQNIRSRFKLKEAMLITASWPQPYGL